MGGTTLNTPNSWFRSSKSLNLAIIKPMSILLWKATRWMNRFLYFQASLVRPLQDSQWGQASTPSASRKMIVDTFTSNLAKKPLLAATKTCLANIRPSIIRPYPRLMHIVWGMRNLGLSWTSTLSSMPNIQPTRSTSSIPLSTSQCRYSNVTLLARFTIVRRPQSN